MSFVGTRPEVTKYVKKYTKEMRATLLLPAGITSEASIQYKDEAELLDEADDVDKVYVEKVLPEKMKYNLESIRKFGFWREIGTMVKTVVSRIFLIREEYQEQIEILRKSFYYLGGITAFFEVVEIILKNMLDTSVELKKNDDYIKNHNLKDGLPIPPYAVYNIGNSHPENLLEFVDILQQELISAGVLPEDYDFDAHKKLVPMQPGDVPVTYADTTALEEDFGFKPQTSLREGLRKFVQWYAEFYK